MGVFVGILMGSLRVRAMDCEALMSFWYDQAETFGKARVAAARTNKYRLIVWLVVFGMRTFCQLRHAWKA